MHERWVSIAVLVAAVVGLFGMLLWLGKDIEPRDGGDTWTGDDDGGHGHDGH
jgi:hypothetical protein